MARAKLFDDLETVFSVKFKKNVIFWGDFKGNF